MSTIEIEKDNFTYDTENQSCIQLPTPDRILNRNNPNLILQMKNDIT